MLSFSDPPSLPSFSVVGKSVSETVNIIEETNTSIKCSSDSEPAPLLYSWTFAENTYYGEVLSLMNVQKQSTGPYYCIVSNEMVPTAGPRVTGKHSNIIFVDILCKYGHNTDMQFCVYLSYKTTFMP